MQNPFQEYLDAARPKPRGPFQCDFCGRFVAVKDARLIHEYSDYGSIHSTEVMYPACNKHNRDE